MKDMKLLPKITLLVLLAIGIVISAMFYMGGNEAEGLEVAGDMLSIPVFSNLFLTWNYILVALVILVTLAVVVYEFVQEFKYNKKGALNTLFILVGAIALCLLCWFLGSPEEMKILGYEGTENVGFMAQLTDAMMYLTYILILAVIVTIIWSAVYKALKK